MKFITEHLTRRIIISLIFAKLLPNRLSWYVASCALLLHSRVESVSRMVVRSLVGMLVVVSGGLKALLEGLWKWCGINLT